MYCFRIVSTAAGILILDELQGLFRILIEVLYSCHIFVSLITIEERSSPEFNAAAGTCPFNDIEQVVLQEVDLVIHRTGGIHDKGDVCALAGGDGFCNKSIHIDLFSKVIGRSQRLIPFDSIDCSCECPLYIDIYRSVYVKPKFCRTLIVADCSPFRFICLIDKQLNLSATNRITGIVNNCYCKSITCI